DYVEQGQNDSTQSRMQAGSSFKTFTLIAALEDGYPLSSSWDGNSPKSFAGGWQGHSFNNIDHGRVTLKRATTSSITTASTDANPAAIIAIGPERTQEMAIALGLPEDTPGLDGEASNVLGSASPTVLEMAEVYATIASGGIHRPGYMVESVEQPDGSMVYQHEAEESRVLEEDVAINATVALQGPPSAQGSARKLQQVMGGRPIAGKTGTSESFRSRSPRAASIVPATWWSRSSSPTDPWSTSTRRRRAGCSRRTSPSTRRWRCRGRLPHRAPRASCSRSWAAVRSPAKPVPRRASA